MRKYIGEDITIRSQIDGNKATLSPEGRIDTITSPELEEAVAKLPEGVTSLTLDLSQADYVSSAGLRVLLGAQKRMGTAGGTMTVTNVCEAVRNVFDITGFSSILTSV